MKNPFRIIRPLADWLDDHKASRQVRKLKERYAPLVAEAEKKKDWNERNSLLSEWSFESDFVLHPVYERRAAKLTAKARKYAITVPAQPKDFDEESDDWYASHVFGFWLPTRDLEQQLRRQVREEERASYDEFRKWATLVFAIVGSALAFISVISRHKQPDPCPRNYYRNDSGECAFALQKNTAPAQPTTPAAHVSNPAVNLERQMPASKQRHTQKPPPAH